MSLFCVFIIQKIHKKIQVVMRRAKTFLTTMLSIAMTVFCSCSCDDDPTNAPFVICPATQPYPPVSQMDFNKYVVNKGWKQVTTHEILEDGTTSDKDYYENTLGLSPIHYYFEAGKYTIFYLSDSNGKAGFLTREYTYVPDINAVTSKHLDGPIFKIAALTNGQMHIVHLIYKRSDGTEVYGYSIYKQMTETELEECRRNYPVDFNPYTD